MRLGGPERNMATFKRNGRGEEEGAGRLDTNRWCGRLRAPGANGHDNGDKIRPLSIGVKKANFWVDPTSFFRWFAGPDGRFSEDGYEVFVGGLRPAILPWSEDGDEFATESRPPSSSRCRGNTLALREGL